MHDGLAARKKIFHLEHDAAEDAAAQGDYELIARRRLTPRQLETLLDVPQPRVSELASGKISRMTADLLTKYSIASLVK